MLKLPGHTRYDYSPIGKRPLYDWPGGKRLAFHEERQAVELAAGFHLRIVQHDSEGADAATIADGDVRHLHHAVFEEMRLGIAMRVEGHVVAEPDEVELREEDRLKAAASSDFFPRESAARSEISFFAQRPNICHTFLLGYR